MLRGKEQHFYPKSRGSLKDGNKIRQESVKDAGPEKWSIESKAGLQCLEK